MMGEIGPADPRAEAERGLATEAARAGRASVQRESDAATTPPRIALMSGPSDESRRGWRVRANVRSAQRARRRNTTILLIVALGVMIAATAAFVVPMLITP